MNALKKAVLLLVLGMLLVLPTAAASKPVVTVSEYVFITPSDWVPEVRPAGKNLIIHGDELVAFTGAYEGITVYACDAKVHLQTSVINFHCVGNFEGSVNGVSGRFIFEHTGRGILPAFDHFGQYTVRGATGALAGYHAHGTFEGSGDRGTFVSNQHTDP